MDLGGVRWYCLCRHTQQLKLIVILICCMKQTRTAVAAPLSVPCQGLTSWHAVKQTSISVCTPTQLSPYSKTEANQLRRKPQQQLAVSIGCLHVFGDLMNVGRVSQDLCLKDFIEHPIPPCLSMDTKDFHPSLLTGESGQTTRPPPTSKYPKLHNLYASFMGSGL